MKCLVVVSCLVLAAQLADANPVAKQRVDAGVDAYKAGDYETAISEFQAAYAMDPDPNVLYALAQANRLGGHCEDAVALYQRYIQSKPTKDQRVAAENGISLCEQQRPWPQKEKLPPTTTTAPTTTTPSPVETRPPVTEPVRETPAILTPAVEDRPRPWYSDRLGAALTIGGVVSIGTGVTFLVLAGRSEDAAARESARANFVDRLDEATLRRRIGYTAIGVGSALAIAGIVRYATWRDTSANVAISASGASFAVSARF
jgi:tetratricopeptide (TPR) repeat protein